MIAWVVDSSTELTNDLRGRDDLFVVQDYVNFPDGRSLKDDELGGIDNLLEMMEPGLKEGRLPKTSNPSPQDFKDAFEDIKGRGYSDVIALLLPPGQSGTWNSARLASELVPGLEYHIPKIRTFSIVTTALLEKAMSAGLGFEELQGYIEKASQDAAAYLALSSLEYAAAGGRIGRAQSMLGQLLGIKPLIGLEENGILYPLEKVRTMGKATSRLSQLITADLGPQRKIIGYAGKENEAHAYALHEMLPNSYVLKARSGALVANSGPFLAVAGIPY
jgi:DegV family protein with EDD domain